MLLYILVNLHILISLTTFSCQKYAGLITPSYSSHIFMGNAGYCPKIAAESGVYGHY